jgi:hypothetical protein
MKKWASFFFFLAVSCSQRPPTNGQFLSVKEPEASPKLFFQPAFIFDSECEHRTGFKVDSALREELLQKLPIFRAEWTSRAGALISASEKVAGRFFSKKRVFGSTHPL